MHWRVYRLALEDYPLARVAREAREAARHGGAMHPELCIAYESAELAAMSAADLLWAVRRRTGMLRETIQLPVGDGLHQALEASRFGAYDPDATDAHPIADFLVKRNLLTAWLPCAAAPMQHAVLINPLHPAFAAVTVDKRLLVHTRPLWTGQFELPEDEIAHESQPMAPRASRRKVIAPHA